MDEALDCSKKLFQDDQDEPLLFLISLTNFYDSEFDCKNKVRDVIKDEIALIFLNRLDVLKEESHRQTFFQAYQKVVKRFQN